MKRRISRAFAVLLSLALGASCSSSSRTELVVVVASDLTAPGQLARVVAHVRSGAASAAVDQSFDLATVHLPFSFGVVPPGGDASQGVDISLDAVDASGHTLFSRRATTGFLPGKTLILELYLASGCRDLVCAASQTCTERGCAQTAIDPGTLPGADPGKELAFDAGTPSLDAGGDAAAGLDAAPVDGSAPDTGAAPDTGTPADSGLLPDAGAPADSSVLPDGGAPDSGTPPDAGASDGGVLPAAGTLDFASAAQSTAVGTCSSPVVVERRDLGGHLVTTGTSTLTITATAGLSLFGDASCATALTAPAIADGSASFSFRYRTSTAGSFGISVSAPRFGATHQTETLTAGPAAVLAFATAPQTLVAGACSGAVNVTRADAFGNPTTLGNTGVQLSSGGAQSVVFHAMPACGGSAVSAVVIPAGSAAATFTFTATAAGTFTLGVSASGVGGASQVETVNAAPGAALSLHAAAGALYPGQCTPRPLVLSRSDAFGNPAREAALSVQLSTTGGAAHAYAGAQCAGGPLSSIAIAAHTSSTVVYFAAAQPGTSGLTAQAASLTAAQFTTPVQQGICAATTSTVAALSSSWCWSNPPIQGDGLRGMATSGAGQTVAVGDGGQILVFNGGVWSRAESGTTADLAGVTWAGATAFAVGGGGEILRGDGTHWSRETSPTVADLLAVWGDSDTDVWAVGAGGVILRRGAGGWSMSPSPSAQTLRAVFGFSPSEAFAVGDAGTLLHWNGTAWSGTTSGASDLFAVWGATATDVWAGGANGALVHFDGSSWSNPPASGLTATIRGLFGASATDVWAVGDGRMAHWNRQLWNARDPGAGGSPGAAFYAVSGGGGVAWAGGARGILARLDLPADIWTNQYTDSAGARLNGVFGASPADVWAVGDGEALRFDGVRWNRASGLSAQLALNGAWGSAANDVYLVGAGGAIAHWTGSGLDPITSGTTADLLAVWGSGATDVWAVGSGGTIAHGGGQWTSSSVGTSNLRGVSGSGPSDVWAVGDAGTILHWAGAAWTPVAAPASTPNLNAVWAASASEAWAVGDAGTILHFSGGAWLSVSSGSSAQLLGVFGTASAVWAVGAGGTILENAGGTWVRVASGTAYPLAGTFATSDGTRWAVGGNEAILRH